MQRIGPTRGVTKQIRRCDEMDATLSRDVRLRFIDLSAAARLVGLTTERQKKKAFKKIRHSREGFPLADHPLSSPSGRQPSIFIAETSKTVGC